MNKLRFSKLYIKCSIYGLIKEIMKEISIDNGLYHLAEEKWVYHHEIDSKNELFYCLKYLYIFLSTHYNYD